MQRIKTIFQEKPNPALFARTASLVLISCIITGCIPATKTEQKEAAQEAATAATNELNTVYYAIGTGKELKEKKILESGFLRKTKVMKGDFDMSYFTAGDRRTLTVIPTHSNKAKVLTSQPKDSYTIMDQNGQKVIKITDPAKFWQLSNFLVIEVG